MGTGMNCTKCGAEEQVKGSPWGKKCRAEAAKGRRMLHGDATKPADATSDATSDATNATGDATRKPKQTAQTITEAVTAPSGKPFRVTALLARVEELEAEVGRLKRELATANARPATGRELSLGLRSPLDAVSPGQGAVIGKATVASQTAVQELRRLQPRSGVECIHGGWVGSCRVLGCQAKR